MKSIIELVGERGVAPTADWPSSPSWISESHVTDVGWDAFHGTAHVIMDLRMSLDPQAGNTAVLVVEGVSKVAWNDEGKTPDGRANPIAELAVRASRQGVQVSVLFMSMQQELAIVGSVARLHIGTVPGLPDAGNAVDELSSEQFRREYPTGSSLFVVTSTAQLTIAR